MLQIVARMQGCFPEKFATPRQGRLTPHSYGSLVFEKKFRGKAWTDGLDQYSFIWLLFGFHQNSASRGAAKVRPPRWSDTKRGVFATRSPHRPNPIGLSLVELVEVRSDLLQVRGHDLIDGTPVYDIKPYIPEYDRVKGARVAAPEVREPLRVQIPRKIQQAVAMQNLAVPSTEFLALLRESLRLDPRPRQKRGQQISEVYGVRVGPLNFHFVVDHGVIRVTALTQLSAKTVGREN